MWWYYMHIELCPCCGSLLPTETKKHLLFNSYLKYFSLHIFFPLALNGICMVIFSSFFRAVMQNHLLKGMGMAKSKESSDSFSAQGEREVRSAPVPAGLLCPVGACKEHCSTQKKVIPHHWMRPCMQKQKPPFLPLTGGQGSPILLRWLWDAASFPNAKWVWFRQKPTTKKSRKNPIFSGFSSACK